MIYERIRTKRGLAVVVAHTEGGDPIVVDQKLFDAGATWAPHARIERGILDLEADDE